MKKLLILLLFVFSLTAVAQDKRVAILNPEAATSEVTTIHRSMVRGEMEKAIGRQRGFKAFTRADIDQIVKEVTFQQSGMVDDETKKRLGLMKGVDFLCVTRISKEGNNYYLEGKLVNVESGEISSPTTKYGELQGSSLANMLAACEALAAELVGGQVQTSSSASYQSNNYSSSQGIYQSNNQMQSNYAAPSTNSYVNHNVSEDCEMNVSLFHELVKQKNFADALEPWRATYKDCPSANRAIYTDGEKIMDWLILNEKDAAKKAELVNELMALYDNWVVYYGTYAKFPKGRILGRKGCAYVENNPSTKTVAYDWLKESVDLQGAQSEINALQQFIFVSLEKYKQDASFAEQFISDFVKTYEILDTREKDGNEKNKMACTHVKRNISICLISSGVVDKQRIFLDPTFSSCRNYLLNISY